MRGMARFRQGRLAPSPTAFGMLAHGLCALVGLRKALGNGAGVLFEVKPKEQLANRPITCDYSERIVPNARKALREASKTLETKTEEQCRKGGLPMEEENEYTGMTAGEMQRFLDAEAEQGASELEAYRKLMRILEVEFPSKE